MALCEASVSVSFLLCSTDVSKEGWTAANSAEASVASKVARSLLQCGDGKGGNKDQKAKRGGEKHYLFSLNKDRVSCIANSEKTWMVPCPSASRNLDEKGTDGPYPLLRFVVRARRFCCFLNPPSSLRKDAKDWWCTKVRFRAALYKKKRKR